MLSKLRAIITFEIEAGDFVAAAEHQRRLEDLMDMLRREYPTAELEMRERRRARLSAPPPSAGLRRGAEVIQYRERRRAQP